MIFVNYWKFLKTVWFTSFRYHWRVYFALKVRNVQCETHLEWHCSYPGLQAPCSFNSIKQIYLDSAPIYLIQRIELNIFYWIKCRIIDHMLMDQGSKKHIFLDQVKNWSFAIGSSVELITCRFRSRYWSPVFWSLRYWSPR